MTELKSKDVPNVEELLGLLLVTNMRIYDTLLLILKHNNNDFAEKLAETHELFQYVGTLPFIEKEPENA